MHNHSDCIARVGSVARVSVLLAVPQHKEQVRRKDAGMPASAAERDWAASSHLQPLVGEQCAEVVLLWQLLLELLDQRVHRNSCRPHARAKRHLRLIAFLVCNGHVASLHA